MGTTKHSDNDFLTVLLQDNISGLQVLNQNQWVDVLPVHGVFYNLSLMINLGAANIYRVLANKEGPRVSVACFFRTDFKPSSKLYGPIKELLSDENPPIRETILLSVCSVAFSDS